MPANTPRGYTYATADDANDVPLVSQRLAEQIDADMTTLFGSIPAGRMRRTSAAAASIAPSTWVEVAPESAVFVRGGMQIGGSPGRFIVPRAGVYLLFGSVTWAGNATGRRGIAPLVNSLSTTPDAQDVESTSSTAAVTLTMSYPLLLSVGDTVSLQAFQDSTGSLSLNAAQATLAFLGF